MDTFLTYQIARLSQLLANLKTILSFSLYNLTMNNLTALVLKRELGYAPTLFMYVDKERSLKTFETMSEGLDFVAKELPTWYIAVDQSGREVIFAKTKVVELPITKLASELQKGDIVAVRGFGIAKVTGIKASNKKYHPDGHLRIDFEGLRFKA